MTAKHDRIRNLGTAGILAVAAVVLAMLALPHRQNNAQAASGTTVGALVATHDLAVGTSVESALSKHELAVRQVPAASILPDALTAPSEGMGKVVVQPIYAGEQVTERRLGGTGAAGLRSVLTGTERIIQISGAPTQLLAGTLRAGDHVDVVVSVKRGTSQTPYSAIALHNLVVLDAPAAPSSSSSAVQQTESATVQLTDRQAQRLFFVLQNGNWSFVLRPVSHVTRSTNGPIDAETVLQGGE